MTLCYRGCNQLHCGFSACRESACKSLHSLLLKAMALKGWLDEAVSGSICQLGKGCMRPTGATVKACVRCNFWVSGAACALCERP